ncbi:hypothetical protein GCK72_016017 [Caenorhabditis remanei]|uniref:Uncharacterized protein n=1 Tax=Caenorhabditis remanei TaxID=31234 RepID=A0A6A5GVL8_CAERE|nr:hypothetical protein GCK72_016017 [Caenorhabditis remanei]KAF1759550.1 hypothetical protein GCK72_016017 [Caenorhabditis remanei]
MTCLDNLQKKYPNLSLILLGISIGISAALDISGVFTNNWVCFDGQCGGIVPFDSSGPAWLTAASFMLFISIGVMVVVIALYFVLVIQVLNHGYHINFRKWFLLLFIISSLALLLIFSSFAVIQVSLDNFNYKYLLYSPQKLDLGWSCALSYVAIVPLGLVLFCIHRVDLQCI